MHYTLEHLDAVRTLLMHHEFIIESGVMDVDEEECNSVCDTLPNADCWRLRNKCRGCLLGHQTRVYDGIHGRYTSQTEFTCVIPYIMHERYNENLEKEHKEHERRLHHHLEGLRYTKLDKRSSPESRAMLIEFSEQKIALELEHYQEQLDYLNDHYVNEIKECYKKICDNIDLNISRHKSPETLEEDRKYTYEINLLGKVRRLRC